MVFSYIRSDKHFVGAYEQLKLINSYAMQKEIKIDDEMVDQTSQNNRLNERNSAIQYIRSHENGTLLIYDLWVLSSNIEDVVQMCSCLLKNSIEIHIIKPSIVIDRHSDVMLVLSLIDNLRQTLQAEEKKRIGRPKGSRSSSKFDQYLERITEYIRLNKSVSEMARELGVSRSSLKDYIESREIKEIVHGSIYVEPSSNVREEMINNIKCPNTEKQQHQKEFK